ncbi:hypothetical protein [Aliidiomarina indica]|uniref:hypothetical protein n=1 Tax=Aliidiomarina indica TaxID=2749147 RepID=UPI00188F2E1D|nr:hypothetical protein [Aliidiomarina indica]
MRKTLIISGILLVLCGGVIYLNHFPSAFAFSLNMVPLVVAISLIMVYSRVSRLWRWVCVIGAGFTLLLHMHFQLALLFDIQSIRSNDDMYNAVVVWSPVYSLIVGAFVSAAIWIVLRIKQERNERI